MLVGYLGAALAAKAFAPRIGLGTLVAAALLLDIVFWLFVLLRLEDASVPADFSAGHMLVFDFPWSHSLVGALFWSAGAGLVWAWSGGEGRYFAFAPFVIAATAFSHWILDFLVHPAELPIWGPGAPSVGLDLGQPAALVLDLAAGAMGLLLYLRRAHTPPSRRMAIAAMVLAAALLGIFAAHNAVPPAGIMTLAVVSLVVQFGFVTLAAIADRER